MDFYWYSAIDLHSFCTRPVSALIWNQRGTATSSEAGSVLRVKLLAILDILWLRPHSRRIESLSPSPSGRPPWDLISEKYCMVVNGERQQIFWSRLNCALIYTYDVCQFKRYILKSRKSQLDVKLLRYKTVKIRNYKDYKPKRRTCDVIPFLSMNEANFTEANVWHFFYSLTL